MTADEKQLNSIISSGNIEGLFLLYGKELFLTKMYATKIISKTLGKDYIDLNYTELKGNPDPDKLEELVMGLPVFADKKVVSLSDFNPEESNADEIKKYINIFKKVPPETVFVIFSASIEMDNSKEKTKKIIAAAAKNGIAVKFDSLKDYQTAEKIQKKAEKAGRIISRQNALYIAQLLLCDLTAASNETSKLIAYTVPGGEITREIIDKLVSKQISVSVFGLAAAITAGKRQEAFNILDELFIMRTEPVNILSALSMTYVDFYRAKTALRAGVNSENTAADFEYPYKRTFAVGKAFSAVRNITPAYLRNALRILNRADIKLKSIPVSSRIILEQAVVQLMVTKK